MTQPVIIPAGHELIASDFDAYEELTEPWVAYAPVWTGTTTNPVVGNGSITGAFKQVGKTVFYRGFVSIQSTTTPGSGIWELSWPVPPISLANTSGALIGSAYVLDSSTGAQWPAVALSASVTALRIAVTNAAGSGFLASASPVVWAAGDRFSWFIIYEAA